MVGIQAAPARRSAGWWFNQVLVPLSFVLLLPLGVALFWLRDIDADLLWPMWLILGPLVVLFLGWGVRMRRRGFRVERYPPSLRVEHTFLPGSSITLTGGAQVGWWRTGWPLVRLTVDRDYAQLRGPLIPTVWIPREGIFAIRRVQRMPDALFGTLSVQFQAAGGVFDGILFMSLSADETLSAFGRLGWPVASP